MKDKINRLQVITAEIQDIIKYSLGIRCENTPKGFEPLDESVVPQMKEEQDAYAMMEEVMTILENRQDVDATKQKIDHFSEKLADLSFKPESKKNSFKFYVDDTSFEVIIEQRYLIYFYIHNVDKSVPYFIGTAFHFSLLIKLLDFFQDRLKASNQLSKHFEKLLEDVKEAADKFRPEWKEIYDKPLIKSSIMDQHYFTERDTDKIKNELHMDFAGGDIEKLSRTGDINAFFSELMDKLRTNPLTGLEDIVPEVKKHEPSDPSSMIDQFSQGHYNFDEIIVDNEHYQKFAKSVLQKYTIRNKLTQLKMEIDEIKNEIEDTEPLERRVVNKFPLIKDSLLNESEEEFLLLLKEMTMDDKNRLIDFLKEQEDAFFKKRNKLFFNAILNGVLLLDDELIHRMLPLVFSDPSFLIDGYESIGISKEKMEEEIKKKMPELFNKIESTKVPEEIKEKAQRLGEEIADRLFVQTKDQLTELFNNFSDAELPAQIAKLVNPYLLEEITKWEQYNE
ncbi:MAG: hypothetical protein A2Y40_00585 [Candidatus Margulisbacteria bacterium GWF2_35_9]|nr:MAG: hypothetical protein A2Y40_00585 [Candidatus Margulisbacteria bacterium GWF2_35_9]